jgi:membrane-bound ClpP family serine protease
MRTNHRPAAVPGACACGLSLLLALGWLPAAAGAGEPAAEGQCLAVRNPITSEEVNRLKEASAFVIAAAHERTAVRLIFDFNPTRTASTAEFGPCNELAEYLLGLRDVTTIAFVHGEVTRHTVLPVLACKELVMSADARLGPVVEDKDPPLTPTKLQGYKDIIRGRSLCPAVVLKLLDPDMEVLKGLRKGSVWYIDARREKEERDKEGVIVGNREPVVGKGPAGYGTAQAQEFGLCQRKLDTLQEVVREYNLPPTALREDAFLGRNSVVARIIVSGPVTRALSESLQRRMGRAIGRWHANVIILELDCGGGDPAVAQELAESLYHRKDDRGELPVRTIAYVRGAATGTATLLALGCSEIVLHKDATIGDLSVVVAKDGRGAEGAPADEGKDGLLLQQVKGFARDHGYPTALIRAMAYPNLQVDLVDSAREPRRLEVVTQEERDADARSPEPRWKNPRLIQSAGPAGKPLILDATRAEEVRLMRPRPDQPKVVDLPSLCARYGFKPEEVRTVGNDWLDEFADVLRLPAMSVFLILLGATCLVLELKMPGLGLPGVVAALCFVLFFWAHAHDAGITLLAVLLFVLGLVLIALEVFMLPGSAVFGISGVLLVISSLTLVTLDRWPQTTHEWINLGGTMATFGLSLGGAVVAALVLAWYLPHVPYFNRLILKPPGEVAEEDGLAELTAPAQADASALLGAIGVAATPLRPAGKVKFGDDYVDVVAEGSYVPPGARVQVIEIEGYRIVVKEV